MTNARMVALSLLALTLAAGFPISGQSVVSTHSGVIYFFVGSAFLGDEPLEQKVGRSPESARAEYYAQRSAGRKYFLPGSLPPP